MALRTRTPTRLPLLLAAAAACVYLLAAGSRDFWSPDEPDFAQHVREMLERRDLLVPYQNGKPYSEKPILFYWAIAATTPFTGFDVSPLGTRAVSVLAGGLLVFGAAWLAGLRGGPKEALLAGSMTAVSSLVFWQSQFLQIDALFTAELFWLLAFQLLVEEDPARAPRWRLAFQVLLALAVLTKGPLALALAGLVATVRCVSRRSLSPITGLGPLRGAVICIGIVVPWYVAASLAGGPEYTYDLIVKQNWVRFTRAFDHIKPWWFYLESIWGDFFPWTLPALAAPFVLRRAEGEDRPELRFAATAIATVFVFLSLSQSKQGKYILVVYPLAAVLLAAAIARIEEGFRAGALFLRAYALLVAGLFLAGGLALVPVARRLAPEYASLSPYVAVPLAVGGLGVFVVAARRRGEVTPVVLSLCAALAAAEAAGAAVVFPALDPRKTGRAFYERIGPGLQGRPLAYWGPTYRCYPILVLRRRTEHFFEEEPLVAWLKRTKGARLLADRSESQHFRHPVLRSLIVEDSQPVGGDVAELLRLPGEVAP